MNRTANATAAHFHFASVCVLFNEPLQFAPEGSAEVGRTVRGYYVNTEKSMGAKARSRAALDWGAGRSNRLSLAHLRKPVHLGKSQNPGRENGEVSSESLAERIVT